MKVENHWARVYLSVWTSCDCSVGSFCCWRSVGAEEITYRGNCLPCKYKGLNSMPQTHQNQVPAVYTSNPSTGETDKRIIGVPWQESFVGMCMFPMATMSRCHKLGGLRPHTCIPPCSRCSGESPPDTQFLVVTSIPWLPRAGARHCDLHSTPHIVCHFCFGFSILQTLVMRYCPHQSKVISSQIPIHGCWVCFQIRSHWKGPESCCYIQLLCWTHLPTHNSKWRKCWAR